MGGGKMERMGSEIEVAIIGPISREGKEVGISIQ
jgi:hypothetical protein